MAPGSGGLFGEPVQAGVAHMKVDQIDRMILNNPLNLFISLVFKKL